MSPARRRSSFEPARSPSRPCRTRWARPWFRRRRHCGIETARARVRRARMEAATMDELRRTDPEIARAIAQDTERQRYHVNLIASENYASRAVLEALGTPMSNKYAEGYPGKRYYGGCEFVDGSGQLAVDRATTLFGAQHANVQPPAGPQADLAADFGP